MYTKAPWTHRPSRSGGQIVEPDETSRDFGSRKAIATIHSTWDTGLGVTPELPAQNAVRICECVNALDGVKDPAGFVEIVRALVSGLDAGDPLVEKLAKDLGIVLERTS